MEKYRPSSQTGMWCFSSYRDACKRCLTGQCADVLQQALHWNDMQKSGPSIDLTGIIVALNAWISSPVKRIVSWLVLLQTGSGT